MDGALHMDWAAGNASLTALALRRASLLVAGEGITLHHFERQSDVISDRMPAPSALARIAGTFSLDAGALDALCIIALADQPPVLSAALQAHPLSNMGRATRAVICAVLGDEAAVHLAPASPLMASGLVEQSEEGRLFERPLSLCSPALELLQGRVCLDPLWADLAAPLQTASTPCDQDFALSLARAVNAALQTGATHVFYSESDPSGQLQSALYLASQSLSRWAIGLSLDLLPETGAARAAVLKTIRRDLLLHAVLPVLFADPANPAQAWQCARALRHPLVLIGAPPDGQSDAVRLDLAAPLRASAHVWSDLLGNGEADKAQAAEMSSRISLTPDQAARAALAMNYGLAPDLWTAARGQISQSLGDMAQRVDVLIDWDDLVLPPSQRDALSQMAQFIANRHTVNEEWGFASKTPRGLGMAALFHGESGTGKTTAAEALIRRIQDQSPDQNGTRIDLYRVNVASLVSKYIGETSKNFRQVFEAGAATGAALLFDEAEGLFGKRSSQTRDSNDKHANAELGFLLQCLEAYPGIAILTTNMRDAIDDAFFRRFRFAIEFPFPDRAIREEIWRRCLPEKLPVGPLDFAALSALSLAGGNIRSIVVNAAYLAASDDRVLHMHHLAHAARLEFAKLEKPAPEREIARWSQ